MRGTPDHRIRNFALFDFVWENLLKMHIALGFRDFLPFWTGFGLKIFAICTAHCCAYR